MSAATTLDTRRAYEGKILSMRIDTVQMGQREPVAREVVEHPGSVVMVPITEHGTVLLVRQWRQPAGRTLLELPAGTRDPGDSDPNANAQRELREEVGRRAETITRIGGFWVAPGWCTEYMDVFVATGLEDDPLPQDADENVVVDERPLSDVLALIRSGEIEDAKSVAALLMVTSLYPGLVSGDLPSSP